VHQLFDLARQGNSQRLEQLLQQGLPPNLLQPTLVGDLVLGSSLDRSGERGVRLWKHHFGQVVSLAEVLAD
ncbi:hypothetical protein ACV34A_33345, partial [Pseudomonas aeruginosa]